MRRYKLIAALALVALVATSCAPRNGLPQFDETEQQRLELIESQANDLAKRARIVAREDQRPVELQDLINGAPSMEFATAEQKGDIIIIKLLEAPEVTQCLQVVTQAVVIGC